MLVVTATVLGKPDERAGITAALAVCAAASRNDPGCTTYAFWTDVEDPDSYASIETWDSQEQLDAHMQTPHVAALLATLADKIASAPVITTYDVAAVR